MFISLTNTFFLCIYLLFESEKNLGKPLVLKYSDSEKNKSWSRATILHVDLLVKMKERDLAQGHVKKV